MKTTTAATVNRTGLIACDVICLNLHTGLYAINCSARALVKVAEANEIGEYSSSIYEVVCSLFEDTPHPLTLIELANRPTYRLVAILREAE